MSKLTRQDSTSEFATENFNWYSDLSEESHDLVDVMRNQLHRFLEEAASRDVTRNTMGPTALPEPDAIDSIEKAIQRSTVRDIKVWLKELDKEIVRVTAVRALVIATKKEIKKVVNT